MCPTAGRCSLGLWDACILVMGEAHLCCAGCVRHGRLTERVSRLCSGYSLRSAPDLNQLLHTRMAVSMLDDGHVVVVRGRALLCGVVSTAHTDMRAYVCTCARVPVRGAVAVDVDTCAVVLFARRPLPAPIVPAPCVPAWVARPRLDSPCCPT